MEPTLILDHLYLGGIDCYREDILRRLGINVVIRIINGDFIKIPNIIHYHIPLEDIDTNISQYFDFLCERISYHLRNGDRILVHCVMGVSRSATIILAYLMKEKNMSFSQALHYVQSRRNIIRPNDSFLRQLRNYDITLHGSTDIPDSCCIC